MTQIRPFQSLTQPSTQQRTINHQPQVQFGLFGKKNKDPDFISYDDTTGKRKVPDKVIIPFINGEGIGEEVMPAAREILDAAVELAYDDKKDIHWEETYVGEVARQKGASMPEGSGISEHAEKWITQAKVAYKGPTGTLDGTGARSVNVELRQKFNLFANIRPVKLLQPDLTPISKVAQDTETGEQIRVPVENIDTTIFRENTEDVYMGIEFESGSEEAAKLIEVLKEMGANIPKTAAIGIKPMSPEASKKIIEHAFQYAIVNKKPSVTVVHKGNIQKFTEGMFLKVAIDLAKSSKYADFFIDENTFYEKYQGDYDKLPEGKVVLRERKADALFAEVDTRPENHHVIVTPNLNGDYISDAYAGTVGGLGVTPGANIGDEYAIFEAVHGTAPDIAGENKANPTALVLSGKMMLEHLGWHEAANLIQKSIEDTLTHFQMTGDLASRFGAQPLSTTEFTEAVIKNMTAIANTIEENSGNFFTNLFSRK